MRRIAVLNSVMCETFLAGLEGYGSSLDASRPPGRLQKQDQRRMMLSAHDVSTRITYAGTLGTLGLRVDSPPARIVRHAQNRRTFDRVPRRVGRTPISKNAKIFYKIA